MSNGAFYWWYFVASVVVVRIAVLMDRWEERRRHEAAHPLDCLTDWMEDLENTPLDELRRIRHALGHDVEASEREFLEMLERFKGDTKA